MKIEFAMVDDTAVGLPTPPPYVGADDGDDDGDVVFAFLWNAWSWGCALYNATRRLSLMHGSIPT